MVRLAVKYWSGPISRWFLRLPQKPPGIGERLRLNLEELGITYVKLGQYLATRFDLLPLDICAELNRLYEGVPPVPMEQIRAVLERELGQPLEQAFRSFQTQPVAAASVAQVHEATLHTGERAAIKIQRPGIEAIFRSDVRNLRRIAAVADFFHLMGLVSIKELVDELDRWTSRELDFRIEGRTADLIRMNATPNEIIPFVYWDLTTARVLTLEFVEGVSLAKIADLIEAGKTDEVSRLLPNMSIPQVGRNLATACLNQFFVTGVFHGDPHPGNLLIRDDSSVAFVDFGIFGELGPYERESLASYVENAALGNIEESYRYYAKLVFSSPDADMEGFARQAKSIVRRWYVATQNPYASVEERHMGKHTADMFDAVRIHRLRVPMNTMLFWRALNALDSSALRLSSVFDLMGELRKFFEKIRPSAARRVVDAVTDYDAIHDFGENILSSPGDFSRMLEEIVRRNPLDSSLQETPEVMRRSNSETASLAAAIIGISLMTLGAAVGPPQNLWFVAVAMLLYAWIFAKMWRT